MGPPAAQRARALVIANDKRLGRARLLRAVRAGDVALAELIERRPPELASMMLFDVALALPQVAARKLTALNHRAIIAKINLAQTFGEASAQTLAWLDAAVNEGGVIAHDNPVQPVQAPLVKPRKVKWPLQGTVGFYRTAAGEQRRLVLTVADDRPILVDRNGSDERLVETFRPDPGLLEVAAVASAYLDDARNAQRPVVAR